MLHYDVWAEGLGRLYFLDPNWLASMVAAVLKVGILVAVRYILGGSGRVVSSLDFHLASLKPLGCFVFVVFLHPVHTFYSERR